MRSSLPRSDKRCISLMVGMVAFLFTQVTVCEELSMQGSEHHWMFAPYMWMPDLNGFVGMGPLTVYLDLDAKDLAGNLKAAAMGYLRYGDYRQFVYLEGLGMRFRDNRFEPFLNQAVDATVYLAEIGCGRHYHVKTTIPTIGEITFSPYIGLRNSSLEVKITSPVSTTRADENWLDVSAGMIIEGPLHRRLSYFIKLDGAGFDLDKSSYWNALGGIQYHINNELKLGVGYRWAEFDANPGNGNILRMKLRAKGPQVGLIYLF